MAIFSVKISSPSYVAGVISASTIWGMLWCVYSLRSSNTNQVHKQISSNNEDDFINEEISDKDKDSCSRDEYFNSKQSISIWKMMWKSVRATGKGWQNEKNNGNVGQPSKKKVRWRWESIRRKGRTNEQSNSVVNNDTVIKLKANGVKGNEVVGCSSQPRHLEAQKEAGPLGNFVNDDKIQKYSLHGIQANIGSDDPSPEEKSGLCIGSIFGLDIGGTLAKLVYFQRTSENEEQKSHDNDEVSARNYHSSNPDFTGNLKNDEDSLTGNFNSVLSSRSDDYPPRESAKNVIGGSRPKLKKSLSDFPQKRTHKMKRVRSMFDIAKTKFEQRARALSNFYTLASRLVDRESGFKEDNLSFHSSSLGGEFHFVRFETRYMTHAMEIIRAHSLHLNIEKMGATGGGAHKYATPFIDNLGIEMATKGEMDSLVAGLQFVLSDVDGECYTFKPNENITRKHRPTLNSVDENEVTKSNVTPPQQSDSARNEKDPLSAKFDKVNVTSKLENLKEEFLDEDVWARKVKRKFWTRKVDRDIVAKSDSYPYMIVIIGTGVSVLRVDGLGKFERCSGSSIGGGTYWGLCRLLTDVEDYQSVLNLAERGKSSKVDMMVGDIYGKKVDVLEKYGLTSDVVASSFGKLVAKTEPAAGLKQEDLARALLSMVTNNIGQVAYLNAEIHNTKRIYFVGNFLRHNVMSQQRLAYAINYWSKGKMEALFLEHEGYLGALGAYLLHQGLRSGKSKASTKKKVSNTRFQKARAMSI